MNLVIDSAAVRQHLEHHVEDEGGFCAPLALEIENLLDEVERLRLERANQKAAMTHVYLLWYCPYDTADPKSFFGVFQTRQDAERYCIATRPHCQDKLFMPSGFGLSKIAAGSGEWTVVETPILTWES